MKRMANTRTKKLKDYQKRGKRISGSFVIKKKFKRKKKREKETFVS